MHAESWPVEKVIPYPSNPRRNARAVARVAGSIRDFGFRQPIVVDAAGVVVVGHTRLAAAKSLGLTEVPVVVATDLTEEQARAYRIADNRIPEGASWDFAALGAELRSLKDMGGSLSMTAMPTHEIETLLAAGALKETGAGAVATGEHRVLLTAEQMEIVQRAADALEPVEADIAAALVRICEEYCQC